MTALWTCQDNLNGIRQEVLTPQNCGTVDTSLTYFSLINMFQNCTVSLKVEKKLFLQKLSLMQMQIMNMWMYDFDLWLRLSVDPLLQWQLFNTNTLPAVTKWCMDLWCTHSTLYLVTADYGIVSALLTAMGQLITILTNLSSSYA